MRALLKPFTCPLSFTFGWTGVQQADAKLEKRLDLDLYMDTHSLVNDVSEPDHAVAYRLQNRTITAIKGEAVNEYTRSQPGQAVEGRSPLD